MTIAKILSGRGPDVVQISSNASVEDAIRLLTDKRIGCLPVVDSGQVVGIISERDIVRILGQHGASILSAVVSDVMTSPALTIPPETDVLEALTMMTERRVRHLPVIDGGNMVGFVSIGDLVKYRIDRIEAEASAMREYIQSA